MGNNFRCLPVGACGGRGAVLNRPRGSYHGHKLVEEACASDKQTKDTKVTWKPVAISYFFFLNTSLNIIAHENLLENELTLTHCSVKIVSSDYFKAALA